MCVYFYTKQNIKKAPQTYDLRCFQCPLRDLLFKIVKTAVCLITDNNYPSSIHFFSIFAN